MVKRPDNHKSGLNCDFQSNLTFMNGSSNELLTFGGVFPSYELLSLPIKEALESLQVIISLCRLLETPLQLHHSPISLAASTEAKVNQSFLESIAELLFEGAQSAQAPRITLRLTLDPSFAQDMHQACREHVHEDTAIFISTLEAYLVRDAMGTHLQLIAEPSGALSSPCSITTTTSEMPFDTALRNVNGLYQVIRDATNCVQELIFYVPYVRSDSAPSSSSTEALTHAPSSSSVSRPCILVIEDNRASLSSITSVLHDRGYEVSTASSQADTNKLIFTHNLQCAFAAILINTALPFAYSSSSRLLQAGECLIGMTIHHNEESIMEALDHGYHAVLSEPFDVDDFEDVFTLLTSSS